MDHEAQRPPAGSHRFLIVSGFFAPRPGGGAETLRNLLHWIDPSTYRVVTAGRPRGEPETTPIAEARVHRCSWALPFGAKGQQLVQTLQIPLATLRAAWIARRGGCRTIVGVCPDLQFMAVAYLTHRLTGLPLAVYLLDLIDEGGHTGYLGALARWLQRGILKRARVVWTISEATADHIRTALRTPAEALPHCYNEPIAAAPEPAAGTGCSLLFCGNVYDINSAALARVLRAAGRVPGAVAHVVGPNSSETLARIDGGAGDHVKADFLDSRADVLGFMRAQDVLVACLSWPEESWVGVKELATIFPTKLPEYLAQGRPILVHCPEDYYLARFVREHDCGWVVSERSEDAIVRALDEIRRDAGLRRTRCENALATAWRFAGHAIARQFLAGLDGSRGDAARHGALALSRS